MSGNFFHSHLTGRWRKAAGTAGAEPARPVVVPVIPQLSVSQMTTYRCPFVEEVAAIAAAGLPGIGLWRTKLSAFDDETVAAVLQEFNVKPKSLSWAGGFTGSLGFSYEEALDDARDAIHQAARWGAENLVVVAGSRNGHTVRHYRRTVRDALLLLADEAGDQGVRLALLPTQLRFPAATMFLNGLDDACALLDELKHPQIGLALDAFHFCSSSGALDRIPSLAARTFLVHLSDSSADACQKSDRLPGEGTLPLSDAVFQFLTHGYQGAFDVQVWSEDVWRLTPSAVIAACRRFAESVSGVVVRFP